MNLNTISLPWSARPTKLKGTVYNKKHNIKHQKVVTQIIDNPPIHPTEIYHISEIYHLTDNPSPENLI
jgi:hypothetical protein